MHPDGSKTPEARLKQELMLLLNQKMYDRGMISRELYEQAKIRLVSTV